MLTDSQKIIHKDFRRYLRTVEGKKGPILNSLINAAENNLPALINTYIRHDFECLYDEIYSLEELISFSKKINSNGVVLAAPFGYISSKALESYIRYYANRLGVNLESISLSENSVIPYERDIDKEKQEIEGRLSEAKVFRRHRNRQVREQCLAMSGFKCYVCGFDFEKVYGKIGKGFLEVHHKTPLSTYDDEHEIPLSELVALCSNCHSMVHRKSEVLDVDKLKEMINKA